MFEIFLLSFQLASRGEVTAEERRWPVGRQPKVTGSKLDLEPWAGV
jgi:hypothetical protein